ncbi:hypothetical protein GUITHDRAFT_142295 [Guillardia theta CCMP2712]|uniref:Myb-like domain-containing protein n=1 Tax=Guillardia theta (strain CCMP2712) TaxID=905079 RepID=L1IXZ9_GUITC|nr:hypothetical protein GUITHDRAFT_142295 [Guillardia theta CCMP2712]EKX41148.1 hypothetical protein GUITHDRAFT_142295 [Guillardia theta CCMP2712]|eukprot:XP_005828128.1 hypothetical protein GUITHDRAFT_142295 [Guillardia theta CCMP2712]
MASTQLQSNFETIEQALNDTVLEMKCLKGHLLTPFTLAYSQSFRCDKCSTVIRSAAIAFIIKSIKESNDSFAIMTENEIVNTETFKKMRERAHEISKMHRSDDDKHKTWRCNTCDFDVCYDCALMAVKEAEAEELAHQHELAEIGDQKVMIDCTSDPEVSRVMPEEVEPYFSDVKILPDGAFVLLENGKAGRIPLAKCLQLLSLSQTASKERLVGSRRYPAKLGMRVKLSGQCHDSFLNMASGGGVGEIVDKDKGGLFCHVKWERTGMTTSAMTGFHEEEGSWGIRLNRISPQLAQVSHIDDGALGGDGERLYNYLHHGDHVVAINHVPISRVSNVNQYEFGPVASKVTLTLVDDSEKWDVEVLRTKVEEEHDASNIHPRGIYHLEFVGEDLAFDAMVETSYAQFKKEGICLHQCPVIEEPAKSIAFLGVGKARYLVIELYDSGFKKGMAKGRQADGRKEEADSQEFAYDLQDLLDYLNLGKQADVVDPSGRDQDDVFEQMSDWMQNLFNTFGVPSEKGGYAGSVKESEASGVTKKTKGTEKELNKLFNECNVSYNTRKKIAEKSGPQQRKILESIYTSRSYKYHALALNQIDMKPNERLEFRNHPPLLRAIFCNDLEVLKRLLDSGADVYKRSQFQFQLSGFQLAVYLGCLDAIKLMSEKAPIDVDFCFNPEARKASKELTRVLGRMTEVQHDMDTLRTRYEALSAKREGGGRQALLDEMERIRGKLSLANHNLKLIEEKARESLELKLEMDASVVDLNARCPLILACASKNLYMIVFLTLLNAQTEVGIPSVPGRAGSPMKLTAWCDLHFPIGSYLLRQQFDLLESRGFTQTLLQEPLFTVFYHWVSAPPWESSWNQEEDSLLLKLAAELEKDWALIVREFPGRNARQLKRRHRLLMQDTKQEEDIFHLGMSFSQLQEGMRHIGLYPHVLKDSRLERLFILSKHPNKKKLFAGDSEAALDYVSIERRRLEEMSIGYEHFDWILKVVCKKYLRGMKRSDFVHRYFISILTAPAQEEGETQIEQLLNHLAFSFGVHMPILKIRWNLHKPLMRYQRADVMQTAAAMEEIESDLDEDEDEDEEVEGLVVPQGSSRARSVVSASVTLDPRKPSDFARMIDNPVNFQARYNMSKAASQLQSSENRSASSKTSATRKGKVIRKMQEEETVKARYQRAIAKTCGHNRQVQDLSSQMVENTLSSVLMRSTLTMEEEAETSGADLLRDKSRMDQSMEEMKYWTRVKKLEQHEMRAVDDPQPGRKSLKMKTDGFIDSTAHFPTLNIFSDYSVLTGTQKKKGQ